MFESKKQYLVLVFILLAFFMLISSASAINNIKITNTNDGGIKKAISDGNNIINLEKGLYTGENNTNINISKNQNVTIQSENSENKATIDGETRNHFIINHGNLTLKNLIIQKFTQTEEKYSYGGAIRNLGNLTLINCSFKNNYAIGSSGGVIWSESYSNLTIIGSLFTNNNADLSGGAIYIRSNSNVKIISSIFLNNTAYTGGAIANSGNLNVSYSQFINNNDKNNCTIYNTHNLSYYDFNWWGSNSNPNSKINGSTVNNYYTIIINEIKAPSILENGTYRIDFVLNGTNNNEQSEQLPKIRFNIYFNNNYFGDFQNNETISMKPIIGKNIIYLPLTIYINNKPLIIDSFAKIFNISKINSQISIFSINGSYGQNIELTARLSSNGKILTNKKVNFYVNGKLIGSKTTNSQGIATLKYKIPSVSKYTVKTVFSGSTEYNKMEASKTFTSTKAKTSMALKNKLYKSKIYVKISALGNPLKNKLVKFYVKGKYAGKAKTNLKGVALFKYSKEHGKMMVKTIFSSDKLYNKVYKTSKIKL